MSWKDTVARGYAKANDDVRDQLITKGWFGQTTREDAMSRDVDKSISQYEQDMGNSAWGKLPEAERYNEPDQVKQEEISAFYGSTNAQDVDASDLYGSSTESGQSAADFYGYDAEQRADMDAFYGTNASHEVDAYDLYGEPAQASPSQDFYGHEIEQDRD